MTNQPKDQTDEQNNNIPAIALPLTGQHMIEASAGTGKTWTLTGIVLRLIVEAGHPCEKIIATTFTKSAAADMRQRIRERLQDFYQLLLLAKQIAITPQNEENQQSDTQSQNVAQEKKDVFLKKLENEANNNKLNKIYEDKLNQYLIAYITEQVIDNNPKISFSLAQRRIQMALNQLDKMFVGTIDSLCQKWLREFSTETGYLPNISITNDYSPVIQKMVHEQFRAFLAYLSEKYSPEVFSAIQEKLLAINDCINAADKAITFYTATIDTIDEPTLDLNGLDKTIADIVAFDVSFGFDNFLDTVKNMEEMNSYFQKKFVYFSDLTAKLSSDLPNPQKISKLSDDEVALLKYFFELVTNDKGFNKGGEQEKEIFKTFAIVTLLSDIYVYHLNFEDYSKTLNQYFTQFIARYIRENLAKVLESQGLTTFSLQLAQLNQVLQSEQGKNLAKYIRHQYPIALIDESQDVNTEQALLIHRLYLQDLKTQKENSKDSKDNEKQKKQIGFLLLVGDPKQAIYGFRGGDVKNYTTLKTFFPKKPHQLTVNFRSSKALIDSLNVWYGVLEPTEQDDNNLNEPANPQKSVNEMGDNIVYHKIDANRNQAYLQEISNKNTQSIFQLRADYKQSFWQADLPMDDSEKDNNLNDEDTVTEADMIVAQIALWFDKNADEGLIFRETDDKTGTTTERPLTLSDICILATQKKYLDNIEKKLHQHGIATVRGGRYSVFEDSMASDLFTLMSALLNPYHQEKLRSLLLSNFFQLKLRQVNDLLDNSEKLETIQQLLVKTSELWEKNNFLHAVQSLFNQPLTLDEQNLNIWQRLAQHEKGERWVIDIRQLFDIINEFLSNVQGSGMFQLYDWYAEQLQIKASDDQFLQHPLTSDTGVKLMTMHNSKGLEFEVVFLVGLTDNIHEPSSTKPHLFLYTEERNTSLKNRHLTPLGGEFAKIEAKSLYEEKLRLMYVALTRAKERVYIVTVGQYNSAVTSPLKPYVKIENKNNSKKKNEIKLEPDVKTFHLDERLLGTVKVIDTAQENSLSKKMAFLHNNRTAKILATDEALTQTDSTQVQAIREQYRQKSEQIQTIYFQGWKRTSFSKLNNFSQKHDILQSIQDDIDTIKVDEYDEKAVIATDNDSQGSQLGSQDNLDLRFRFEKGTMAGTFLHHVLENLLNHFDKTEPHKSPFIRFDEQSLPRFWSKTLDDALLKNSMPDKYLAKKPTEDKQAQTAQPLQNEHIALANWLNEVVHSPLKAPSLFGDTLCLKDIGKNKQAEMGFNMRINNPDFSLDALNTLFNKFGKNLNLQSDKPQIWQYLNGEIDLVYEHNNRFYVIDYKSNFLGNHLQDYQSDKLNEAMNSHHYWLQAMIYQVALHRFLSIRLPNYDINQHLGAVEYLFLRGLSVDEMDVGRMVWQIPSEFVLELDALLGNIFEKQLAGQR